MAVETSRLNIASYLWLWLHGLRLSVVTSAAMPKEENDMEEKPVDIGRSLLTDPNLVGQHIKGSCHVRSHPCPPPRHTRAHTHNAYNYVSLHAGQQIKEPQVDLKGFPHSH